MNRVDTHFHIWDLTAYSHPWLPEGAPVVRVYGSSAPLRRSYVLEDFLGDCTGSNVTSAVHVQCGMRGPVDEAPCVQRAHQQNPRPTPAPVRPAAAGCLALSDIGRIDVHAV